MDSSVSGTEALVGGSGVGYVTQVVAIDRMCGPFEYTFQDFLNDASEKEWDEWEQKAAELELPLDYYLAEFV